MLEERLQVSDLYAILSRSRILFSGDAAIQGWHKNLDQIGERDKETQLMNTANDITWSVPKAEKWFYVKQDYNYSFLYIA